MLLENLALAALMVALTVVIHFAGIAALVALVRRRLVSHPKPATVLRQGGAVVAVVLALFGLHTIQIWLYAALYLALGEFETLEAALYFSTSAFTTVGFGDVYLDETWRLLSSIQSANGFLLIGWSTAYLVSIMNLIRDIDRDIAAMQRSRDEG
ncbi:MAG: potassium channel family protein [Pseudomonadota bacterium]